MGLEQGACGAAGAWDTGGKVLPHGENLSLGQRMLPELGRRAWGGVTGCGFGPITYGGVNAKGAKGPEGLLPLRLQ